MPGVWHWKHLLSSVSFPGASGKPIAFGDCWASAACDRSRAARKAMPASTLERKEFPSYVLRNQSHDDPGKKPRERQPDDDCKRSHDLPHEIELSSEIRGRLLWHRRKPTRHDKRHGKTG